MAAFPSVPPGRAHHTHPSYGRQMGAFCVDRGSRLDGAGKHLGEVICVPAGAVADLLPAAGAHGDDIDLVFQAADGRKEYALANCLGNVVVLSLVSERTCHTATAAVYLAGGGSRDRAQQL